MALTTWSATRVCKSDVIVAKNDLSADEVDTLNRPVLNHAGSISNDDMKVIAYDRCEVFEKNRRGAEALAADEDDLKILESIEKQAKRGKK